MVNKKNIVSLSDDERTLVRRVLRGGSHAARILRRCQMLLKAEEGKTDKTISKEVGCSVSCVANLRKRFAAEGLKRALYDAPREGAPIKFSDEQLMAITHLSTEAPPDGQSRWTLEALCNEAAERGIVDSISIGRMYELMKSYDQPPRSQSAKP